ncbi:phosphoribosylformylglycinamidine synthase subunit PurQ [Roseivirga sp. BDSF3-8]|uniref:phosphoribosylformylglycinamidine synthase subunit PurQ n=1 Tax=Roseivirga sp. BDSF3-8 TaxID=3241598 RepID=UPI003531C55C
MKFGVIIFPGSNCDQDIVYALREGLGQEVVTLWHKDTDLQGVDFVVVPGGFSYGDYLRSGAIARFSPIMNEVIRHADKGGYVLGICNGFQILTESHLLPGALLRNREQKFICKNAHIVPQSTSSVFTNNLEQRSYKIPVAHAEGRFFASEASLEEIKSNDQVLFRYADEQGNVTEAANINGSLDNIAGIMNKQGNVFGMMPHPERACDSALGNLDGKLLLENLLQKVHA